MIRMNQEDLTSQAGMERALRDYFARLKTMPDVTFNRIMDASLVSCDYEKRTLLLRVETKPWMENPNGVVHGGVSAALLDMTMGSLCRYFTGGGMTPTISMQINYLRPVPIRAAVFLQAELPRLGGTICHTLGSAWVEGQEDKPACTATGVYYAMDRQAKD